MVGWFRINARKDQINDDFFRDVPFGGVMRRVICSYEMKTLEQKLKMKMRTL